MCAIALQVLVLDTCIALLGPWGWSLLVRECGGLLPSAAGLDWELQASLLFLILARIRLPASIDLQDLTLITFLLTRLELIPLIDCADLLHGLAGRRDRAGSRPRADVILPDLLDLYIILVDQPLQSHWLRLNRNTNLIISHLPHLDVRRPTRASVALCLLICL